MKRTGTVRVGTLEINANAKKVAVFQSSEEEGRPCDFIIIRTALEAETLVAVLTETFALPDQVPSTHTSAVTLGRRGGKKGGKARADVLTPTQRSQIAKDAANARWSNKR